MIIPASVSDFNIVLAEALQRQKEEEKMMIDRENRVKIVKNVGQYIIDNAENIIPQDGHVTRQKIVIDMAVEMEIPKVTVVDEYIVKEALHGVKFTKG